MSLLTIIAIAALLQATCAALDLFLLKRQRARVQVGLVAAWNRLDDLHTPDLPGYLANRMAPLFRLLVGPNVLSVRALLSALVWSTTAAIGGFFAYGLATLGYDSTYMLWLTGPWKNHWQSFLLSNTTTAIPSFLVTSWMILGARGLSPKQLAPRLVLGLLISAVLALVNFHVNTRIAGSGNFSIGGFPYIGWHTIRSFLLADLEFDFGQHMAISFASFALDLFFLVALLLLLLGKLAITITRLATLQLLEAASEKSVDSLAPFSILGVFANAIGACLKLSVELLK